MLVARNAFFIKKLRVLFNGNRFIFIVKKEGVYFSFLCFTP